MGPHRGHTESTSIKEGSSARSLNVDGRVFKKGLWTLKEDTILVEYVKVHGEGNWNSVWKNSTLLRSGKSCRLRWINHLRPNLKKGAFTPEEQQMIIKMHARIGNKWAQMAAHLPGRTDNEIKNYWNTRIKKLQRAGLPIHPHNVYHQVLDESHQKRMISCGAQQHNEIFNADMALSYASEFPNISMNNMISHGNDSQGYGYMNPVDHAKQLWASGTSNSGCHGTVFNGHHPAELFQINSFGQIQLTNGLDYQHVFDPVPTIRIPTPFEGEIVCDGNSSATLKPELPSFQYAEPGDSSCAERPSGPAIMAIDEHFESSLADVSLQSDCFSLWDDGYLKLLLYGTHAPRSGKRYLPEKYYSSSATTSGVVESSGLNLCRTEAKDYCDLISSSCSSAAATINEIMPPVVAGPFPEFPAPKAISGSHRNNGLAFAVSVEEDRMLSHSDFTRPDALLGECWMQGSRRTLDHSITSLLGEQFCNEHEPPPPEAAFLVQGLGGLDSFPWDRMPDACQMLDLP